VLGKSLDFSIIRDFTRFLHGYWEKEIVLMELLQIFQVEFGCSRAEVYLLQNGEFKLKVNLSDSGFPGKDSYPEEILKEGISSVLKKEFCRPFFMKDNFCEILLGCDKEVYGAITCEIPDTGPDKIQIMGLLALQASIAIRNSKIADEKRIIEQVVSDFASGLDMQVYYPRFARHLGKIVNFDRLTITIPDPLCPEKLVVYGEDINNPLDTRTILYEGSAPQWVISSGKYILEEDLKSLRMFPEDSFLADAGVRCALRVPLLSKGKIIGTLNIGSGIPSIYEEKTVALLAEVAARIGPTVENALIYEKVNKNLRRVLAQLEENFSSTINAFTVLLDRRDNGTKGHSLRVVRYSSAIAEQFGLKGSELEQLRLGALLHDIGKIAIPDSILFKTEKLTDDEWDIMRTHPMLGAEMVSSIEFLSPAVPVVLYHHERFDGTGYPAKLAGEEIPLAARIFAVADAFDAITSKRPYRDLQSVDEAVCELERCTGTQFCPRSVDAFLSISRDRLLAIYTECKTEITLKHPAMVGMDFKGNLTSAY